MSMWFDRWGIPKQRGKSKARATDTWNSRSGRVGVDRELAVKLYEEGHVLVRVAAVVGAVAPGGPEGGRRREGAGPDPARRRPRWPSSAARWMSVRLWADVLVRPGGDVVIRP